MGRTVKSYAENESSPVIFSTSEFPFGDKTFKKFSAALDAFAALPQAKIEAYDDVKRALLQRQFFAETTSDSELQEITETHGH